MTTSKPMERALNLNSKSASEAGSLTAQPFRARAAATPGTENIDPQEVAYYEQLASTWWDRQGPFWPLHRLNELRTAYLRVELAEAFDRDLDHAAPLHGLDVLDVGCGGGILSESMARLGASVHGVDVVERNIAIARKHARDSNLDVRYDTISTNELAQRGVSYDVVLNMEVVEHVPDVPMFMDECARLLRPEGVMSVATINRNALSWLFAIVGAEYILRWLPRGTHRWRQFVTPEEIEVLLAQRGVDVYATTGVRVNPFNRHFALTKNLLVNYMLLARRGAESPRGGAQ